MSMTTEISIGLLRKRSALYYEHGHLCAYLLSIVVWGSVLSDEKAEQVKACHGMGV